MDNSEHISQILKALVYIEEHLDEELLLDTIAKEAHISPYHFHRLFLASMGETLYSYIRRLRLEKARGKLQYSNESIFNIALDVGYESHAGFCKAFKAITCETPLKYRERMRPIVAAMMQRMTTSRRPSFKIVYREDLKVLFARETGNYNEVPARAFQKLFMKISQEGPYYSMALDDPSIVDPNECRFDACIEAKKEARGLGKKVIQAGRYACFTHQGPYENLTEAFQEIYANWLPFTKERLADLPDFCEHLDFSNFVTKIYIPLLEPQ
jgi:AraC family transcriptional regulator